MKKIVMAAAAIMTAAGPILASTPAAALTHPDDDRGWDDDDRRGGRDRDRDWDRNRDRGRDWDRDGRRWDRDHRRDFRGRRGDRWDRRHYNGYYLGDRFYYGPPPAHVYRRGDFHPYYRAWRRGERLPPYYRSRYVVVDDYYRYRLRPPPRGYHWVRDDRGDYLLVGLTTGVILGLILGSSGY
jgi:Ni/Co efflux regulator RcnB